MRVKNIEDGTVHYAVSNWKSGSLGHLKCDPSKKVATYSPEHTGWMDSKDPITCPDCLALSDGRAAPRTQTKKKAGRGLGHPEKEAVSPTRSSMSRIKTNGWTSMAPHKFGKKVTHGEDRQRSKNVLRYES